jgi:hypothetical protein
MFVMRSYSSIYEEKIKADLPRDSSKVLRSVESMDASIFGSGSDSDEAERIDTIREEEMFGRPLTPGQRERLRIMNRLRMTLSWESEDDEFVEIRRPSIAAVSNTTC